MKDMIVRANRAQYRMARGFIATARTTDCPEVRAECVRMAHVCRQLIARNRQALAA